MMWCRSGGHWVSLLRMDNMLGNMKFITLVPKKRFDNKKI